MRRRTMLAPMRPSPIIPTCMVSSVRDHTASYTGAGVPGGITLVVVGAAVEHQRGAAILEKAVRGAGLERDARVEHVERETAVGGHVHVRHVAGVHAHRVF